MTLIKRYLLAAVLAGCSGFPASTSHAFMMGAPEEATADTSVDLTGVVEKIRVEMNAEGAQCETILGSIDAAIGQIDSALDRGVVDEQKYLGLRDELVEMRLDLPCLGNKMVQGDSIVGDGTGGDGSTLLSETVIGESVMAPGSSDSNVAGGMSGGTTSSTGMMSGGGGGSAGSGSLLGSSGMGPLGAAGIAAAIAVPIAVSDDAGDVASPSN